MLKLRTTRTFIALPARRGHLAALCRRLSERSPSPSADCVLTDVFTADTSSLFIIILAVVGISGEWRHRTITSSLLAAPDRLRFLAAKTLAFAVAGLLLSLTISLAVSVIGYTILSFRASHSRARRPCGTGRA